MRKKMHAQSHHPSALLNWCAAWAPTCWYSSTRAEHPRTCFKVSSYGKPHGPTTSNVGGRSGPLGQRTGRGLEKASAPHLIRLWDAMSQRRAAGHWSSTRTHLHHELPAAREAALGEKHVLRLLLLLCLLDLGQSADWVHHLTIFWAALHLRNKKCGNRVPC